MKTTKKLRWHWRPAHGPEFYAYMPLGIVYCVSMDPDFGKWEAFVFDPFGSGCWGKLHVDFVPLRLAMDICKRHWIKMQGE